MVELRNARVGSPATDTSAPTAVFAKVPSPAASAISSASLVFSEPVSGVKAGHFVLRRDGAVLNTSSASVVASGTTYTLSGLSALTNQVGTYTLRFQDSLGEVRDAAGNSLRGEPTLSWSVVGQGTVGTVSLLDSRESFWTYFRQGDNRGEFFYNAQAATLRSSGPYELATFQVGRRWTELQFEIKVSALSFGSFDVRLTNGASQYVIKLDGALPVGPNWRTVGIAYDEGTRTLNAFVDGVLSKQASVVVANWNTSFSGTFSSGGGQNAVVELRNTLLRLAPEIVVPAAPTNVAGTPGNTRVSLAWTAPTNSGGAAITDYIVQFKTTAATSWTTFSDGTSTSTSATVTGLTNGTGYVFRVAAINAAGTGSWSATSAGIAPRR